jgi:phenylpropionate dioxygenase-like ring-hydroxylating dioxygenase large terminal subunit
VRDDQPVAEPVAIGTGGRVTVPIREPLGDGRIPGVPAPTWPRDCWYVVALSAEVDRTLLARRVLNEPVVLFRDEAGKPVALEDRCAHRWYPLSKGTLEGDTVICGYHGFRYGCDGNCLEVPSQPRFQAGLPSSRTSLSSRTR